MTSITKWKFENFLFRLMRPHFWIQLGHTCWEYDSLLRSHIETAEPESIQLIDIRTMVINGIEIRVDSYPSYFGGMTPPQASKLKQRPSALPSPITRKKLKGIVDHHKRVALHQAFKNKGKKAAR